MLTLVSDKNKATAKVWPVCFEEERRKSQMTSSFCKLNLCMFQKALTMPLGISNHKHTKHTDFLEMGVTPGQKRPVR